MGRGAWWALVHEVTKELNTTEPGVTWHWLWSPTAGFESCFSCLLAVCRRASYLRPLCFGFFMYE